MVLDHIGIMVDLISPEHHDAVRKAIEATLGQFKDTLTVQLGEGQEYVKGVRIVSMTTLKPRKNASMYDFRVKEKGKRK